MDTGTLARAMGQSLPLERYHQLTPAFNAALIAANCTTVNRVAMLCAQVGTESLGLLYMHEIADGSDYEWRQDLGNVQPGDGKRFRGHGPLQITGRFNHQKVSEWAFGRGLAPSPTYFVDNPDELAGDQYGFLGVVWYWTVARNMNSYADAGDINGATRAVNGGLNGLDDRIKRWNWCLALGDALLPDQGEESVSLADDELGKKFASRSKYRVSDDPIDTLAGFVLNIDARIHEDFVEREAAKGVQWAVDLVKREATKGDPGALAALATVKVAA